MIRGAIGESGIAYRVDGRRDGPTLVFSNSLGTDHRLWDRQLPAVEGAFRVVRYEACGHGVSDLPRGPVTIERLARDLMALLDHLDVERAVVCGCSLGGVIALWLAVNRPDRLTGAVLANTGAKIGTNESWDARIAAVRAGGTAAVRDQVVGRFLTPEFRARDPETTSLIAGMIEATSDEGYIAACEALRATDLRADASRVRLPVLIVGSERDQSTPPELSRDLHASIDRSELVMIADAAHLSNVEQAALFNAALVRFLKGSAHEAE
ncbi:MAG TPA: 3-oxoadipate enol-lactonase [Gemmatimonadaceae bacterium]|nr:3-oxoadipate enol-lactonase [Gemmatimonadaceae bacterium]